MTRVEGRDVLRVAKHPWLFVNRVVLGRKAPLSMKEFRLASRLVVCSFLSKALSLEQTAALRVALSKTLAAAPAEVVDGLEEEAIAVGGENLGVKCSIATRINGEGKRIDYLKIQIDDIRLPSDTFPVNFALSLPFSAIPRYWLQYSCEVKEFLRGALNPLDRTDFESALGRSIAKSPELLAILDRGQHLCCNEAKGDLSSNVLADDFGHISTMTISGVVLLLDYRSLLDDN